MSAPVHVIFGTGPVGCWTARVLSAQGQSVRVVNRSGSRPALLPAEVALVRADASDPAAAQAAAAGASVVYQAASPPYTDWLQRFPALQAGVLGAAQAAGARFVSIENLYMYDASRPMDEDAPIAPVSRKGALRQRMAEQVQVAHARDEVRASTLRSSDYYGPGVVDSMFGERFFGALADGRPARVVGSASVPHSVAYIEDVARAAAALGTHEAAVGRVWIAPHAPALTQGAMVERACRILGVPPRMRVLGPWTMRVGAMFVPMARASLEMLYQFTNPFTVDASAIENAFGLRPTPLEEGFERTLAWFRQQRAQR